MKYADCSSRPWNLFRGLIASCWKRAIQLSVAEANRLRHHYLGTEHLLLGLVAECHGVAADLLHQRKAGDLRELRLHIVRVLNEGGPYLRPSL
jgi:ATP-dependent Clp protease ATP-binding subunit ClpC